MAKVNYTLNSLDYKKYKMTRLSRGLSLLNVERGSIKKNRRRRRNRSPRKSTSRDDTISMISSQTSSEDLHSMNDDDKLFGKSRRQGRLPNISSISDCRLLSDKFGPKLDRQQSEPSQPGQGSDRQQPKPCKALTFVRRHSEPIGRKTVRPSCFSDLKLQAFSENEQSLNIDSQNYLLNLANKDQVGSLSEASHKNCRHVRGRDSIDAFSSKTPYFSNWKITGFKADKVIITSVTAMSEETQEVTPEFVTYIKERDAALEETRKAQSDLRETQVKLYDAILQIEELEKKIKEYEVNQKTTKTTGQKKTGTSGAASKKKSDTSQKGNTLTVKGTDAKGSTLSLKSAAVGSRSSPVPPVSYHPPIAILEPYADSREYYWKLAEKFQTLPMFQILDAEKKFMNADIDKNGYIDKNELDKVLSDTVGMFVPKQLDEIFKEVDIDNSETIDFYEILVVLNKLFTRRKTNLPQSVQQNYTKTCTIQ